MKHHCKEKRTYIPLQIIIVEDNTEEVTAVDYEVAANSKSSIRNTNLKLMIGALGLSSGVGNSNL